MTGHHARHRGAQSCVREAWFCGGGYEQGMHIGILHLKLPIVGTHLWCVVPRWPLWVLRLSRDCPATLRSTVCASCGGWLLQHANLGLLQ